MWYNTLVDWILELNLLKDLIKSHLFKNEKWEIHFYKNGKINEIYPVKNDNRCGTGAIFLLSGKLNCVISYKNNKRHGLLWSLLESGQLSYVESYKNNKRHGLVMHLGFNEKYFFRYKNDSQHGHSFIYHDSYFVSIYF